MGREGVGMEHRARRLKEGMDPVVMVYVEPLLII